MSIAVSKLQVSNGADVTLRTWLHEVRSVPGIVWTTLRSMVDAWPDEVYAERLVEARLLGRPIFFVLDPTLIRSLLVDQAGSLEREEFMTRALAPALGSGLLTSDGPRWREQRRTAAPMFRPDHVRAFVPVMVDAANATRARWLGRPRDAGSFDLSTEMMRTALHVVLATMTSGEDGLDAERFGAAMEDYLNQTNWKMALVLLGMPAWLPHPGSRRGAAAARTLRAAVAALIRARRARARNGGVDLLGLLLDARDPETGAPMADEAVVDNVLTFVAAGYETTALALTWIFRLLAGHPEVEARCSTRSRRWAPISRAAPTRSTA